MPIDVDSLLVSLGDDEPCGEDLEYDLSFTELEIAAQPKEEQQVGDNVLEGADPDWGEVREKALAVLEQSKDLRAAIYLASAELHLGGFPAFAAVLEYIKRVLDEYWNDVHPQLDADDDNDPTMRVNAVVNLTDTDTVLRAVRRAPLTESRGFGRMTLRHIEVANGQSTTPADMDDPPDSAQVSAAFQDTDDEIKQANFDALDQCLELTNGISSMFDTRLGAGFGPDLSPLTDMLKQIVAACAPFGGGGGDAAEASDGAAEDGGAAPAGGGAAVGPGPSGGGVGGINNPNDVQNAIDRICEYYARVEPSSPVPLLLLRARRLVAADFLTIMKDIASDGVDQVNTLGGIVEEEEY